MACSTGEAQTFANRSHQDGVARTAPSPVAETTELRQEVEQLREAVVSHRQIGIVTGLVAANYGCTTDQAWSLLVRISQDTNIKVRHLARVLRLSFDAAPLGDRDQALLQVVSAQLPSGQWRPHTARPE